MPVVGIYTVILAVSKTELLLDVAVIVVVPLETPVTKPFSFTVATLGSLDVQVILDAEV
jgi:hypothetical protein